MSQYFRNMLSKIVWRVVTCTFQLWICLLLEWWDFRSFSNWLWEEEILRRERSVNVWNKLFWWIEGWDEHLDWIVELSETAFSPSSNELYQRNCLSLNRLYQGSKLYLTRMSEWSPTICGLQCEWIFRQQEQEEVLKSKICVIHQQKKILVKFGEDTWWNNNLNLTCSTLTA